MKNNLRIMVLSELQNMLGEQVAPFPKYNDRTEQVKSLQQSLIDKKYLLIKAPTGWFGPMTKAAIAKLQRDLKMTPTGVMDNTTSQALSAAGKKAPVAPVPRVPSPQPTSTNSPIAKTLLANKMPPRIAEELASIKARPAYANKSFFVLDQRSKLIYMFAKDGKVFKSPIISGKDAQSDNVEMMAKALEYTDTVMINHGYTVKGNKFYKDGKQVSAEDSYWKILDSEKRRFLPKGVYTIGQEWVDNKNYSGEQGKTNLFRLKLGNTLIGPALHGFFKDAARLEYFTRMKKLIGTDVSNASVSRKYTEYVRKNYNKASGGNMSHGCINIPLDFLENIRPYTLNAFVFVIGAGEKGFLVDNSREFFKKAETADDAVAVAASMATKSLDDQTATA